jgi:hypothetical protein
VCIAQHLLQHAPGMLAPLREALGPKGRAVIATWLASSSKCPVFGGGRRRESDFGMPIAQLRQQLQQARFQVVTEVNAKLRTPRDQHQLKPRLRPVVRSHRTARNGPAAS